MLFDIRGFWADERVEGGLWPRGGLLYRLARRCEQRFYDEAAAVVTLTAASVPRIRAWTRGREIPVEVIPTCADHAAYAATTARPGGPHAVWSGSVGTWYRFDLAARLAAALGVAADGADQAGRRGPRRAGRCARRGPRGCAGCDAHRAARGRRRAVPHRLGRRRSARRLRRASPSTSRPGCRSPSRPTSGDLDALVTDHEVGVVLRGEDDAALLRGGGAPACAGRRPRRARALPAPGRRALRRRVGSAALRRALCGAWRAPRRSSRARPSWRLPLV